MEVPFSLTGESPEITVILSNRREQTLKTFHCVVCGRIAFQFYNDVRVIMPGEPSQVSQSPIVVQCHGAVTFFQNGRQKNDRCKTRYYIC